MGFLQQLHCLCISDHSVTAVLNVTLTAKNQSVPANVSVSLTSSCKLSVLPTISSPVTLTGRGSINTKPAIRISPKQNLTAAGKLNQQIRLKISPKLNLFSRGVLTLKAEKLAGDLINFDCVQKLYPIQDVINNGFISSVSSVQLYPFVDEGVLSGPLDKFNIVANDLDYIQPSSYTTSGIFRCGFEVTKPIVRPENSSFRFRASAPSFNRETNIPPKFSIFNIELQDPSGNLIVKYKNFSFLGDGFFSTYFSEPIDNRSNLRDWQPEYPLLQEASGYKLFFDVRSENQADPFDPGFDMGFEEYWRTPNFSGGLIDNLKISAVEVCNSGGIGPRPENYVNFYMEVEPTGRRLEKIIRPIGMPLYPYISEIWPVTSSVWTAGDLDSTTICGTKRIINHLRNDSDNDYITMNSTNPIADSGRLLIEFGHEGSFVNEISRGSFGCGFDESTCGMWIEPSGAFNTLNKAPSNFDDNFFIVDSVSLKVLARKAVGSRNYILDIVGYSDDKLLATTRPSGGFLQNIEGVGSLPIVLTTYLPEDLAIGGETPSDKDANYTNFLEPSGGDHYLLATKPIISSTEFKWYEIPLKIFPDNVLLGASTDYSMSSFFEHLFLDIYPIPSGAEIASLQLLVRYAPQNALNITVQGGETIGKSDRFLTPSSRQINDAIINAGSGYSPRSLIQNVPHGYYDDNVKSNYSRRWRGMEGLVNGPFDPNQFGFDFYNPLLDYPFLSSYYDFNDSVGNTIYPRQGSGNLSLISNLPVSKYNNIGWRAINDSIFNLDLPGYSGLYRTLDWTALASGTSSFVNHSLYGKIADAFSAAIKVDGSNSYARLSNVNISGGFSAYVRFSPGPKMSGVGFNLWNSGVLLSKQKDSNIQFGIGYSGGKIIGFCRDVNNNYVYVQDQNSFNDYSYPLSVVLTYNDNNSKRLKLYTNNELTSSAPRIRASSVNFDMTAGSGDLYLGYAPSSGVGVHGFITEFGLSNSGNLVQSGANLLYKQTSVDTFLNNQHMHWWASGESYVNDTYKLWDYINEDTQKDWNLGDFKYCDFGPAFSQLSKRTGRDLISFYIKNSGYPYSSFITSGVKSVNNNVSYHTQIENDFLRFNLSNIDNDFYAAHTRITKDLPRGYKFADRAIVVETILEHESSGNLFWAACQETGAKLIVSLYAKRKEPYWKQNNWGLINRASHYLESDTCLIKIHSTFNYQDYIDVSEEWALFPREPYLTEFTEKYYSTDVNDMILQYDLVYPSGSPYYSRINIHSANVRLEDAFININNNNEHLNIMASSAFVDSNNLNLLLDANFKASGLNLYITGPFSLSELGFPLFTSGAHTASDGLNLNSLSYGNISGALFIYTSGSPEIPIIAESGALNLHLLGKDIIDISGLPLTLFNIDSGNPNAQILNLFSFGANENSIYNNLPLLLQHSVDPILSESLANQLNMHMFAIAPLLSVYANNSLNMFIYDNNLKNSINLILFSDIADFTDSDNLNLYTLNYYVKDSDYINWYNYNYGTDIELDDNDFASLPANDEIRGVDLIGYGACDSDSPKKAIDKAIITHDTTWREETCNDGGIFRAIDTYTGNNYSGNYYGIRKYTGLVPNVAYNIDMRITTGSTDPIPVPNEWEEWEYGTNNETNFNNVKLIADIPSGVSRNINDQYGYSVAVSKDLLAVGTPNKYLLDEAGLPIPSAGSISVYKRAQDIPGEQAKWEFFDELHLPSGYIRDYISFTFDQMLCFPDTQAQEFCISGQKWNIGQEGRELGYSLDIANSGNRQVIVAGAPGAKWSRQFADIPISGVPVAMLVFTDVFTYDKEKINNIAQTVNRWNILYKYFSAPWYSPKNFQPQIDLKLILCQIPNKADKPPVDIDPSQKSWVYHTYLDKLDIKFPERLPLMKSGILEIFNKAFPRNTNLVDNNIPAIVGIFEDNSPSTSLGNTFRNGVDLFVQEYLPSSYYNIQNAANGSSLSGYVLRVKGIGQSWDFAANNLINTTLDYRNLIATDNLKYITSGVGQQFARSNSYEFQIPPTSGGRVYIFENENNQFNLVQTIVSPDETSNMPSFNFDLDQAPTIYGESYPDRFGYSVAISHDAETISIGSPYSSEPCKIYARQESENDRMYSKLREWLAYKNLNNYIQIYDDLLAQFGFEIAAKQTYYQLSQSQKFNLRTDEAFWKNNGGQINLYEQAFKFSNSDIPYVGTWQWLASDYAGTSRLGWDTDVNDDGTMVVFGAPTDSFNEYDDTNIWYDKINDTWASYTNAGAVRVFESRNYYPHNLVVEYYKFGNLDRTMHPALVASGYYDQMGEYFEPINIPFLRTPFAQVDIPQEAGLAFIITPEVDAASDEIIQRIKEWLALGDRTLVLVGNDPVWEENGIYNRSNAIINKILQKLGSRMRIFAARNEYESLPYCADVDQELYNITPSFVPEYAHATYIPATNMYAKGVGDIRIDLSRDNLQNLKMTADCDIEKNPNCEMPLKHNGDLRAQWNDVCQKTEGDRTIEVRYKQNWPFHFGNPNPAEQCDDYQQLITFKYTNLEPRPILTAAEWLPGRTIEVPARSGCYVYTYPIIEKIITSGVDYEFDFYHIPSSVFNIYENTNSNLSGVFNAIQYGNFIDPDPFGGVDETRDAFLQAIGSSYFLQQESGVRKISDYQTIAAEENDIVLIATQLCENQNSFNSNTGLDHNYFFYQNLVLQTCALSGNIVQLGGWTGRTSFKDAYPNSILAEFLSLDYFNNIYENHTNPLASGDPYNIVWIANPKNIPSETELNQIKDWLSDKTGINKKLVITYNANKIILDNVKYICQALNLNMAPYFSQSQDSYLTANALSFINDPVKFNYSYLATSGCDNGYSWPPFNNGISTKVEEFNIAGDGGFSADGTPLTQFVPISGGDRILYYDRALFEKYYITPDQFWKINAESSVEFPTLPGSGYRVFINWVAEGDSEQYRMDAYADNVSEAWPVQQGGTKFIGTIGSRGNFNDIIGSNHIVYTNSVDFRSPFDKIQIRFNTSQQHKISDKGFVPKTPRILSISGCFLPINEIVSYGEKDIVVGWGTGCTPWYEPAYTIVIPPTFRPIMTDGDKYCIGCKDQTPKLIQDGPVVVAEEFENFSAFNNGYERSRIVVVADSTMIQGQCPVYRNGTAGKNQLFIRSLYPQTLLQSNLGINNNLGLENTRAGKQFKYVQKLIAPERGSPGKYYSVSGIVGLASNFGTGIYNNTSRYTSNENNYNPATLSRAKDPETFELKKKEKENFEKNIIPLYRVFPRLSGGLYLDPTVAGGIPDTIKSGSKDWVENHTNYVGDLFGYSVSIHSDNILVGAVGNGLVKEYPVGWSGVINSGDYNLNNAGGAGAVFAFEKTFAKENGYGQIVPWEFKQKIRPSSLKPDDKFGHDLSMDADFVAIGAPKHDYKTSHQHIYAGSAAFIRKEFTESFNIPQHIINNNATEYIQDIGAVFTYENKLLNWQDRSRKWTLAERINASGYQSPKTGDYFGKSVYIDRARRGDADYTLIVGSPLHDYATSGNHYTGTLSNAGAAYVYDAMLREQVEAVPNSGSWISAKVFGAYNNDSLKLKVHQNIYGDSISYDLHGLTFTNQDGEIYLEASGFDPAINGFVAHRPYVEYIKGQLVQGSGINNNINLFISGTPPSSQQSMNLFIVGPDVATVYNNMNLYTSAWNGVNSGSGTPPLNMVTIGESGILFSGGLNFVTSGVALANNTPLNLRIRGN